MKHNKVCIIFLLLFLIVLMIFLLRKNREGFGYTNSPPPNEPGCYIYTVNCDNPYWKSVSNKEWYNDNTFIDSVKGCMVQKQKNVKLACKKKSTVYSHYVPRPATTNPKATTATNRRWSTTSSAAAATTNPKAKLELSDCWVTWGKGSC